MSTISSASLSSSSAFSPSSSWEVVSFLKGWKADSLNPGLKNGPSMNCDIPVSRLDFPSLERGKAKLLFEKKKPKKGSCWLLTNISERSVGGRRGSLVGGREGR